MHGHAAAHEHKGFSRLVWVALGVSLFSLFMLARPAPAQAQVGPVCPEGVPSAHISGTCRPVCEIPSFQLRAFVEPGLGSGTFEATAKNPRDPGIYQTHGDSECAVRDGMNDVWDVKQFCSSNLSPPAHCVHWHVQVAGGLPVPATTLLTATADPGSYFMGWDAASTCVPSLKLSVDRNVCSILMSAVKDVTATFEMGPDLMLPTAPVLTVEVLNVNTVKLSWTASTDAWLGGYEILRNGVLYTVRPRVSAATTSVTLGGQLCKSTYKWQVRAFDGNLDGQTASNEVTKFMGSKCPKAKRLNTQLHVWPPKVTTSRSAYFHWGAKRNGDEVAYSKFKSQCRLDKGKWKKCSPGKTYKRLAPGKHKVRVRAYDAAGYDKTPATYSWTIRR